MPSTEIQWFPGHMAKTRRLIRESLADVDIVLELLDARIPKSSRNPELCELVGQKPVLSLLNKASLADPAVSTAFLECYRQAGEHALLIDCINGSGLQAVLPAIRDILQEKLQRYEDRGMKNRRLRAMVVGIPNVGKSTLINKLAGSKKAKAENRPGVTTAKQWIPTSLGLDLLDMPGVLWPKFGDRVIGENLAVTGAIKDAVLQVEEVAMILCLRLREYYPELFYSRYKITPEEGASADAYDLFCLVGRRRNLLIRGGEIDEKRTAEMLLDEFRNAKIGRISLERPSGKE